MRETWVAVAVVVVAVVVNAEFESMGSNEKYPNVLTLYSSRPTPDQPDNSVKQKRCSYNLKSSNVKPSELKLLLEQRRAEALCKFCKKSELRMKSPLCKKCLEEEISPSNTPYLLKSTVDHLFDKSARGNNLEREENSLNTGDLNSLKTNSNVRESILKLIKSPFVSNTVETEPAKMMEQKQNVRLMEPWKLGDYNTNNDILENSRFQVPTTDYLKEQNEIYPTVFENLRTKRLKDIRHLSHNDYLQILKEALRSEEDIRSLEIEKRNSNDATEIKSNNSLKRELLNDILNKHVLEMDSESDEDISDIIGGPPSDKIITKRTTEELTTEPIPTTKQKSNSNDNEVKNKLGNVYHSVFNYKKHPREKLQYINKEWIMTKEPPTKSMSDMDSLLQEIAPNTSKPNHQYSVIESSKSQEEILHSMSENIHQSIPKDTVNDQSTTKNSILMQNIENANTLSPIPTNEKITKQIETQKPVFTGIRNQHFLNRHLYLKNPRLKSVYENGKHKYVHENLTTLNWDILKDITVSTTETITTEKLREESETNESSTETITTEKLSEESETNESSDEFNLLEVANPTELKIISTRSTKDTPISSNIAKTLNPSNELKNPEIFPTRLSLLHRLKSPLNSNKPRLDIFSGNLNMTPKIDSNKFKNVAISMKNSEIKETGQNKQINTKENSLNKIKTSQIPISNNEPNNLESVLEHEQENKSNVHLSENKINLPLILKQNNDGTIQLILDKTKICDCPNCTKSDTEKYVYKRKTEDDLTNHPLNVFNILENHRDQSSLHPNNYYQGQDLKEDLKEKFYEYLINQQLLKIFESLNIPVQSSAELHSYIDDLEDKEKNKLKQYLLSTISREYSGTEGEKINEELFNKKQNEFVQSLLNKQKMNTEMTTRSNRISLQIKSENDALPNNLKYNDNSIIKSLIQREIQKGIENICPICNRQSCVCKNNDRVYFPIDNNSNEGRIIDKRHYVHDPQKENSFNDHDNLTQKKYKIVNNFLNWARDIVVHNNTKRQ